MDPTTLAMTMVVGLATTGAAIIPRTNEVVWSAMGTLVWSVVALGATNVETFSGGVVFTRSYESLAFVGIAFIGLNVIILLFGTAHMLDPRDDATDIGEGPPI